MRPLVKIHGGKFYLKEWIISHFPENYESMTYIEPCIGGGSIILNKKLSNKEIINDINSELINIYEVLIRHPNEFINQLQTITYSEQTFERALRDKDNLFEDNIDAAVNEYILCRMSRGGIGQNFSNSNRLRGNQLGDHNAWETSLNNLKEITERIKCVTIDNNHFKILIDCFNNKDVFIYFDPTYLSETRVSKKVYKYEMTFKDHKNLLQYVKETKCKILLSGYDSDLYNLYLKDFNKVDKMIVNHSGQNKIKSFRKECLWMNY